MKRLFYVMAVLREADFGDHGRVTLTVEFCDLLREYLNEAITTDGKRPLTETEEEELRRFMDLLKDVRSRVDYETAFDD